MEFMFLSILLGWIVGIAATFVWDVFASNLYEPEDKGGNNV